jgi:hypothetical protein
MKTNTDVPSIPTIEKIIEETIGHGDIPTSSHGSYEPWLPSREWLEGLVSRCKKIYKNINDADFIKALQNIFTKKYHQYISMLDDVRKMVTNLWPIITILPPTSNYSA